MGEAIPEGEGEGHESVKNRPSLPLQSSEPQTWPPRDLGRLRFLASYLSVERGGEIRQKFGGASLKAGRGPGVELSWPLPNRGTNPESGPPFFAFLKRRSILGFPAS